MYMYKLNFKKRTWIVKQYLKGSSTSKIALSQSVTPRSVQKLVKIYKQDGWEALKDHKWLWGLSYRAVAYKKRI